MRFLIIFISWLSVTQSFAQIKVAPKIGTKATVDIENYTGIITDTYADGKPSLWKQVVNGKANGLWMEWYPNGILRYNAVWRDNKGHGRWEYFYPNGQLRSESFYIHDIAQGIYRSYHENGQCKLDLTYINGKKNGLEVSYNESGMQVSRTMYDNDQIVIDQPIVFESGNISNQEDNEWGINFMPDDNVAYFTRRSSITGEKRIYKTAKVDDKWSQPVIASFSKFEDESPFITKNGKQLLFASFRPNSGEEANNNMDMNLWTMDKTASGWSEPRIIPKPISKKKTNEDKWPKHYEAGPVLDDNGNLYYWTKSSVTNATNIYQAKKSRANQYEKPSEVEGVSDSRFFDTTPCFAMNDSLMIFGSDNRIGGFGGSDLYYSIKKEGRWTEAVNLGAIVNSSKSEGSPSISPDGKYIYFSSNRGNKKDANGELLWDIYYMETQFLDIKTQ